MVKRHIAFISFVFVATGLAWSGDHADISQLLRQTGIPESQYSVVIARLDREIGEDPSAVLFKHREFTPRTPASTNKIVTSMIALEKLGPGFSFETPVYFDENGNFCIYGSGDPSLTYERMQDLAQKVKQAGLSHIPGDIILDESKFPADTYYDLGEFADGQLQRPYGAKIGSLSHQFNSLNVTVYPKQLIKGKPKVSLWPSITGIPIENNLVIGRKNAITISFKENAHNFSVVLNGSYFSNSSAKSFNLAVQSPALYAGLSFKHHFTSSDATSGHVKGTLGGKLRLGQCDQNRGNPLVQTTSAPISGLIKYLGKYSINMVAELLALAIGDYSCEASQDAFCDYLIEKDIPIGIVDLKNGSGLSRSSKIDAWAMGKLLHYAFDHFEHKKELMNSLSVAGSDGTLKHSFTGLNTATRTMIGKTGTLGLARGDRISSLVFRAEEKGKPPIIGVFFFDGPNVPLPRTAEYSLMRKKQEEVILSVLSKLPLINP